MSTWGTEDLCFWLCLDEINLSRFCDDFREIGITGSNFVKKFDEIKEKLIIRGRDEFQVNRLEDALRDLGTAFKFFCTNILVELMGSPKSGQSLINFVL